LNQLSFFYLREGNGNPESDKYDSLADFYINQDGHIELRIPWLLIQAKDPSQREMTGKLYKDGLMRVYLLTKFMLVYC